MSSLTPIQEFYKDATVFITGAIGFIGKAILEKLLRSCPDVKRIYVLIRPKKGVSSEERLEKVLNTAYFDKLRRKNPKFKQYITIMNGDIFEDNLGLSEEDINIIKKEVNVIIHLAATVRFDEKIKKAVQINIVALKRLIEISKTVQHLKSFVHVSTAYSNCHQKNEIKEEFYEPVTEPNGFIEYVEKTKEEDLDDVSIIGGYPNTYTFTKGLAEDIVRREGKGLPICIVRPSVVIGSWTEPVPGWVDTLYGPLGLQVAVSLGLVHVQHADMDKRIDYIPVDMTANGIIAAAVANSKRSKDDSITIYQLASGKSNPVTNNEISYFTRNLDTAYISPKALWSPFLITVKSKLAYEIYRFFLHTILGYLLDFMLIMKGEKPMLAATIRKIDSGLSLSTFFKLHEWILHDDNSRKLFFSLDERDQEIFNFDVKQIEWDLLVLYNIRSVRVNLLRDPLSTLPEGYRKARRFRIINNILLGLFIYLLYNLYCVIF